MLLESPRLEASVEVKVELDCLIGQLHFPQDRSTLPTWAGSSNNVIKVPRSRREALDEEGEASMIRSRWTAAGQLLEFVDCQLADQLAPNLRLAGR